MTNSKLLPFEDLFKNSWQLFSKGMSLFLTIQLIVFGVSFAISFVFAGLIVFGVLIFPFSIPIIAIFKASTASVAGSALIMLAAALVIGFAMIILFTGLFVLVILGQIALILAIDDVAKGKIEKFDEYFKLARQKFWPALGLFLLCGLIVGAGFLFFILPGIILGFFLIFAVYIFVLENKKIADCISESFKIVKDNFWDIVARYLIVYLLFVAAAMFGNFIPFVNIAVNIFLGIFMAIYLYLLYNDIKVKTKEQKIKI